MNQHTDNVISTEDFYNDVQTRAHKIVARMHQVKADQQTDHNVSNVLDEYFTFINAQMGRLEIIANPEKDTPKRRRVIEQYLDEAELLLNIDE